MVPRAAAAHRRVNADDWQAGWQSSLPLNRLMGSETHGYTGSSIQSAHPVLDTVGAPYSLTLLGHVGMNYVAVV